MTATTADTPPSYPAARSALRPFDPPAEYSDWREQVGLARVTLPTGVTSWVASRAEDVRFMLADPRFSADAANMTELMPQMRDTPPAFPRMDDPEHARLRRMLTGDFTVKRVAALRPQIAQLVDEFLSGMRATGGPVDLVQAFALPVPSLVISLMLGVPYADHDFFQERSSVMNRLEATPQEKMTASGELFGYLMSLVAQKEKEPGDDLISRLIQQRVASGELDRQGVAMNGMILLFAGHETTANMIGLSVAALLRHPEQAAQLRESTDPAFVGNAVEELLRYLSIAQDMIFRVATEDVILGGQQVRAGDALTANLPAANRDTQVTARPDVLDFDRPIRGRHLAFGHGVHQCLGQNLARAELEIALPALLRAFPTLRLAVPFEEIEFRHDMSAYGVHELPVTW